MKSLITAAVVVSLLCGVILAEIPQVISYQGKVTDSGGTPVADGTYTMRFRIYNDATAGLLLWDSGNRQVSVSGGVFNVFLGESPQPTLNLSFEVDYWLLVTFSGVDQAPRQRMAATGYAYMASGLVAGTIVAGAVTDGALAPLRCINTATTGSTYGGRFQSGSTNGCAVEGYATATTGATFGGTFSTISPSGIGVVGQAGATTGITYGGRFYANSTEGTGVCAYVGATTGTATGVTGLSEASAGTGVWGYVSHATGATYGVRGEAVSTEGRGVLGVAGCTTGNGQGVRGESASSTNGVGVYGLGSSTTGQNYGVFGRTFSTDGYGVYSAGNFAASGTKSCVVRTSQGPTLMYCQESPENWFEDFGEGRLVNGRCHVDLDPLFLETVTIDASNPMHVFIQPKGRCQGVYVETGVSGFDVIEQNNGVSTMTFSYRVVAKRMGFEVKRMDYCAAAERDGYLYPELWEKEMRERETEQARLDALPALLERERLVPAERRETDIERPPALMNGSIFK